MNIREPHDRIKINGPNRSAGANVMIAVAVMVIAALVFVIGAQAIEAIRGFSTGTVLRVPRDYPTIQAAIDAASPGNIIRVDAGVYNENIILNKPVSLIAETFDEVNPANNTTVIDGSGGEIVVFVPSDLAQMPIVRGFVIRNGVEGIHAASPLIIEFNMFHTATHLVSYQVGGGGFNRNNVFFNAGGNAVRLDNMDRSLLIENNRIMYSTEAGIEISLQNTTVPPATVQIDIWNNMILGNKEDGIQFVDHPGNPRDTNRRFMIAGNLIANNTKAGIGMMPGANTVEDYSGADMAEAVRVFNNTFYGNDYGITGGDNVVAFNNIFANSLTRGAWRVDSAPNTNVPVALDATSPGNNSVVAYSLFHNNTLDADETSLGAGVIFGVDPLFEAAPSPGPDGLWETVDDDFSGLILRSDSPAIDKGVMQFTANNGELIPPTPITGFTGTAPDLGWREFGAPIFPTPTSSAIPSATALSSATVESPTPQTVTSTPAPGASATASPNPAVTNTPASGTQTAVPSQSPTITPTPLLSILTIDPVSSQADTTVTMTIIGESFQTGALVTFEGGQGLPQEVLGIQVVDSKTIIVTLTARNDGAFGVQTWDVRVTNPDTSTIVAVDAFTVIPLP